MAAAKHAVVLGSRFGGLAVLSWLRRLYSPNQLSITVIDQWHEMIFRPGLVHAMNTAPDAMMKAVRIPLRPFWTRQRVQSLHDTIVGIDPNTREVYTASHPPIAYDVLFIATGSTPGWDLIPGLSLHHQGICEGYMARHTALRNTRQPEGHFVFATGPIDAPSQWSPTVHVGCECPLLESALLWDQQLRRMKRRDAVEITILTPAPQVAESASPKVQERVRELFRKRRIRIITHAEVQAVGEATVALPNRTIAYDRIVWTPPQKGSQWLRGSEVDDGWGWVPTTTHMQHPDWPDIYAVGDVVSHPWPKMGHTAMVQARVAVHHWAWQQKRLSKKPDPYHPQLVWVLEIGPGDALFSMSDTFFGGHREIMHRGRTSYWAKEFFQKAYVSRTGALPIMP